MAEFYLDFSVKILYKFASFFDNFQNIVTYLMLIFIYKKYLLSIALTFDFLKIFLNNFKILKEQGTFQEFTTS